MHDEGGLRAVSAEARRSADRPRDHHLLLLQPGPGAGPCGLPESGGAASPEHGPGKAVEPVARSPAGEDIAPARVTELPLAFNQERRLFLEDALRMRRAPFLPFFVSSGSEISGSFSVSALEEALNAVVGRHGALRSAIAASRALPDEDRHIALDTYRRTGVCRSGVYVQSLHDQVTVRLRRRTLGAESGDQDAEIAALVDRECAATYDLSAPPLMRALLLERHEHEQLLVVVWHHLVSDGWSTQVFRAELEREYARIVTRASEHGALPYSYQRFAASQHQE